MTRSSTFDCPTCKSSHIRRHCDKPCQWVVCRRCHSFGVPGGNWYDMETRTARKL